MTLDGRLNEMTRPIAIHNVYRDEYDTRSQVAIYEVGGGVEYRVMGYNEREFHDASDYMIKIVEQLHGGIICEHLDCYLPSKPLLKSGRSHN